jgi:hypothetical protein
MPKTTVPLIEVGALAGTRAALGLGVGLLIADRFTPGRRRSVGWALVAVGVVTTIPLVASILENANGSPTPTV